MTADKRRTDACLKACEGISTQNLEDNVPFLELARRYNAVLRERDALRAKIEAMERQEPVAWLHETRRDSDVVTDAVKHVWGKAVVGALAAYSIPLYLAPGAQPAQRMNMQTADQVTQAFKAELQALLDKYGAELSARDTWEGYPECGENVRMQVDVPAIYDADHNCLREYTEIDLGSWVPSTQAMPKEAKP